MSADQGLRKPILGAGTMNAPAGMTSCTETLKMQKFKAGTVPPSIRVVCMALPMLVGPGSTHRRKQGRAYIHGNVVQEPGGC